MANHRSNEKFPALANVTLRSASTALLSWTRIAMVFTVWSSATLFGLYILAFYAGAMAEGTMAQWNDVLPQLYDPNTPLATMGIGLHFAAGGIILVQLIDAVRIRYPLLHRILGRVYAIASLLAGLGGLLFIAVKGTIGGTVMNIGFSLYGVLTITAALQTARYAQLKLFGKHRAWALRLFALAIGSWLYRMYYGFWFLLTDGLGHTQTFDGPFDQVMSFFFYLPNLLVAQAFLRRDQPTVPSGLKLVAAGILVTVTSFLLLGTYFFLKVVWGPAILSQLMG